MNKYVMWVVAWVCALVAALWVVYPWYVLATIMVVSGVCGVALAVCVLGYVLSHVCAAMYTRTNGGTR